MSRPHPPILIGGGGEKKTLRMVAQYADSCNIPGPDAAQAAQKLDVLREHCVAVGRDYDSIEKTRQTRFDLGPKGENVPQILDQLHELSELGFDVAHGTLLNVSQPGQLDIFLEQLVPAAAGL